MSYLEFHKECLKTGRLPNNGLCSCLLFTFSEELNLFEPTNEDHVTLFADGLSVVYWGSGLPVFHHSLAYEYTPLRQNIVLFLAAMNNEL